MEISTADKVRQGQKNQRVRRTLITSTVAAVLVLGLITVIVIAIN